MVRPLPIALAVMIAPDPAACAAGGRWHGFANTVVDLHRGGAARRAGLAGRRLRLAARRGAAGLRRRPGDGRDAGARAGAGRQPRRPDIYHIVFDRYGSEETLTRHFGIAEPIGAFLEANGFYVARDSFSNYLSTGHSVASTLHMDYLDELAADPRVSGNNWHPLFAMLDDNRVARFLRGRGYEHAPVRVVVDRHLPQPQRRRQPAVRVQRVQHDLPAADDR